METTTQSTQFLLEEYRDFYQNVMHLENKLFNHLSFYTTLFLGTVTASIAILQLTPDNKIVSFIDGFGLLSLLFILLFIVGRFEIHMTTELRIRKMKFIEGIVVIREYFVDKDDSIKDFIILPMGLKKAPPFLRIGSQDWYQLIYLSIMNSVSFFITWLTLSFFLNLIYNTLNGSKLQPSSGYIIIWIIIGFILSILGFWVFSYQMVMETCSIYDRNREARMGSKMQYDMLDRPLPKAKWRWSFSDWMRFIVSREGNSSGK